MTELTRTISRRAIAPLAGDFGADRGRRLVASLLRGDVLELRPEGTRRRELIALADVFRFAIRCRVGREILEKARHRKQAIAIRREAAAIKRQERKVFR